MKAKYINILACIGVFYACTPQEDFLVDYSHVSIDKVELSADHRQLIADGISTLTLSPMLYQECAYKTDTGKDTVIYGKIPVDRIAEGTVDYYLENGTKLEGAKYTTTDFTKSEIGFYIESNGLKSNAFKVKIREPFPDNMYDTLVYPIVFHILQSKTTTDLGQGIGSDIIEYAVQTLNNCFMRKAAFSPNGANAKIQFRLAEYDPEGKKMEEPGINRHATEEFGDMSNTTLVSESSICWDWHKYLNVWLVDDWSSNANAPRYILNTVDLNQVAGLELTTMTENEIETQAIEVQDIGITFDAREFAIEDVNYATVFGQYFGLLSTADEEEDYCDDTFAYTSYTEPWNAPSGENSSNYGNSRLKISTDGLIFYSVNIMDESSYCNTISMDQVKRIRTITEYCPHRWAYKSQWAFSGK